MRLIEPDQELDELARVTVDAALAVHRAIGPGFQEGVYEDALCVELDCRGVPRERQVLVKLEYRGVAIRPGRIDLLVGGRLVVELKAVEALAPAHTSQVLAYLKAARQTLGLLINFNVRFLREGLRRVIYTLPE